MGLEAQCSVRLDSETADAKALLEAKELILRAPFKRTVPIADMTNVHVDGDNLRITVGTSTLALALGAATATKWAKKIATPAPSLAAKLGIGHASPAYVIGQVDDAALIDALDQHEAGPDAAKISIAVITGIAMLDAALAAHEILLPGTPIWIANEKGPKAALGDNAIRSHMRGLGYRDSKTCAVSERLSATRYARR